MLGRFKADLYLSLLLIPLLTLPVFAEDTGLQGMAASDPDNAKYVGIMALLFLMSLISPNPKFKSLLRIVYLVILSLVMLAYYFVMTISSGGPSTIYDWAPRYPMLLTWFNGEYCFFILFTYLAIRAMRNSALHPSSETLS